MTGADADTTPQGTYCEACREVFAPYVEDCYVPSGQRFTFCQYCACEKNAFPCEEMDAAQQKVWERIREELEARRRVGAPE